MSPTALASLARTAGPAVVGLGRGARRGSGFVVAPGRVLTLASHLRDERVAVAFRDGRTEAATVAGTDADLDLALLTVETGDVAPLAWSDAQLGIGDEVVAAADPAGSGLRVTAGAVAAEPAPLRGRRGRPIPGVIEHTAPVPRGAGGAPLLDTAGAVAGVNALRAGSGFVLALPAAAVRPRVEDLLAGRARSSPVLGVAIVPPRAARRMRRAVGLEDRPGLLVGAVADGSPADRAGVRRGDLIVEADGRPVETPDDLFAVLDALGGGGTLTLRAERGASPVELTVDLSPAEAAR
jgi:S1-C subfamily serine protease